VRDKSVGGISTETNIKKKRKVVDWIKLAGGRVQWQAVVMLINRRVRQVFGISWPVEQRYWLVHSGTKVDCFPR